MLADVVERVLATYSLPFGAVMELSEALGEEVFGPSNLPAYAKDVPDYGYDPFNEDVPTLEAATV